MSAGEDPSLSSSLSKFPPKTQNAPDLHKQIRGAGWGEIADGSAQASSSPTATSAVSGAPLRSS